MAFSLKQQITFRRLVAVAWGAHCHAHGVAPKDKTAKEQWYRAALQAAIGVQSTKDASHLRDYLPTMAHFERLGGEDIYWQTRNGDLDADRLRRLNFALDDLITKHDVDYEYMRGIARQMFDSTNFDKYTAPQFEALITAVKRHLGIYQPTPKKTRALAQA